MALLDLTKRRKTEKVDIYLEDVPTDADPKFSRLSDSELFAILDTALMDASARLEKARTSSEETRAPMLAFVWDSMLTANNAHAALMQRAEW